MDIHNIENEIARLKPTLSATQREALWSRIEEGITPHPVVSPYARYRNPRTVVFGVILLALFGSVSTVYASFSALPGDALFPVQLAVEHVRVSLASPEKKHVLRVQFTAERLSEIKEVLNKGQEMNTVPTPTALGTTSDVRVPSAVALSAVTVTLHELDRIQHDVLSDGDSEVLEQIKQVREEVVRLVSPTTTVDNPNDNTQFPQTTVVSVISNSNERSSNMSARRSTSGNSQQVNSSSSPNSGKGSGDNKGGTATTSSASDGSNHSGDGKTIVSITPTTSPAVVVPTASTSTASVTPSPAPSPTPSPSHTPGEESATTSPADTMSPVIVSMNATPTSHSAVITWIADEVTRGDVYYSATLPIDISHAQHKVDSQVILSHSVTITGLTPATTYEYVIILEDASKNKTQTISGSFTTLP